MLYKSRPLDAILNQRGRKLTTLAKSSLGIRLFKSLRAFGWKLFYPIKFQPAPLEAQLAFCILQLAAVACINAELPARALR